MSTQPTDDQAWQVLLDLPEQQTEQAVVGAFTRAVLAKWGTPTAGGEPAGTVGYTVHGTQYVNWRTKPPAHGTTLYTSPQPVREPAGWLYDWFSDEGELVRDWFTTDYDEAHSKANQAHNIRALDYRGTSPQPVREPLSAIDLMRVVMKADEESQDTRGTTNWAAHIGKAVQNAVLGITGGQHGNQPR